MKPTQLLQTFNSFLKNQTDNDLFSKSFISICFLILLATIIWLGGPYFSWQGSVPFQNPEKRIYLILFLALIWLLKFLIIDLASPEPLLFKDADTRKNISELQQRFYGALKFLKKATLTRHGKTFQLNSLPWYLLIGPENAGKTSLLVNSDVHFVLQRQFQHKNAQETEKSGNCDWWVTKDACIIDVPGKYISNEICLMNPSEKENDYPLLWRFMLRLIKKHRKKSIQGILLTLPLPEILKESDTKKYHRLLQQLFARINELQVLFSSTIPCQLIITKCDQLPGFSDFFADMSQDETVQTWGITLPSIKNSKKMQELFTQRFNVLIKKLNQQLLWRLHQERNPMARPYIKDFPLQVERVKEYILELFKKTANTPIKLSIEGVYLTSALQPTLQNETIINDIDETINSTQRAVQLYMAPPSTRAFFIKQFITQHLGSSDIDYIPVKLIQWNRYLAYTISLGLIGMTAVVLAKDFQQGITLTHAIQSELAAYQQSVLQFHAPEDRLVNALHLMNTLEKSTYTFSSQFDLQHLLTFYSNKSKQKATFAYKQSLENILLPEIENYLEENLKNPINKETELLYATLKAYLMLGSPAHLEPIYIKDIVRELLQKSMSEIEIAQLLKHLTIAFSTKINPLPLNDQLIEQTRRYFNAMPAFHLASIILKNINNNNNENEINLSNDNKNISLFFNQPQTAQVPSMFTAKAFPTVLADDITKAAEESFTGNWVLGNLGNKNRETSNSLVEQLRLTYINNYIHLWEGLLANVQLASPHNLREEDELIVELFSNGSPLLQLLQILHDNTYFEPIASASPKLENLGALIDKNTSAGRLFDIIASLQSLHQYIQMVLTAENQKKAAFDILSTRVKNLSSPDAIIRLRLVATKMPEPIKNWLEKIANTTWHFLMQDASRYLDTAWQEQVVNPYKTEIANRYPFNNNVNQEVDVDQFIHFFGNPGIVMNFYHRYLQAFIDTSTTDWRWKTIDDTKLPFSEETLRHLQHAIRIHHSFFPNNDNKLFVQFTLQPYNLGKNIKTVKLNIYDKQFTDERNNSKLSHRISWPTHSPISHTSSVQLVMANHEVYNRLYPGNWGWLKLIHQSFESMVNKKQMLINISMNENPAQYLLLTEGKFNPFLSMNLRYFNLPQQITDISE